MEIALHTVLKTGHEADYDAAHAVIPARLAAKLRAAGVRDWRIWRDSQHLFHLVDVDDYAAMRVALRDDPDNLAWQALLGPFFEQADSYEGTDTGIQRLWSLADQLGT